MYKPLVPYSTRDVGLYYTRYYILIVVAGCLLAHYSLWEKSFPRLLDVQGNMSKSYIYARAPLKGNSLESLNGTCTTGFVQSWDPAICVSNASTTRSKENLLNLALNECLTWDEKIKSERSCTCLRVDDLWKVLKNNQTIHLHFQFQENVREIKAACGPFVAYSNGYEAIEAQLKTLDPNVASIFTQVFAVPSFATVLASLIFILMIFYSFRGNSAKAYRYQASHQHLRLHTSLQSLRGKFRSVSRQLQLRKKQQEAFLRQAI